MARQHVKCPRAPPPQLTLLLWSLACQSGLRRCRHASSTSAASAMLLCACMSALDHPPALDVCCAAVLVAGLRATVAEWVLFGAQRLRRLHKRAAADADSGTHASAGSLCEA